ncbi:NorB protein [Neisseria meningitidis]|nr:NorB protein [Neisseria meningitidis]
MGQYKKLWYLLFAVLAVCFTILGYMGSEVYKKAPPYPEQVVSASGKVLMTKDDILAGQAAWETGWGGGGGAALG